uniref:Vitelline membrane outer layer 1 homolog n=1 Tax=Anolis carolinensis TaxID=28377 RepID=R4GA73_ANOCA|nr:PREDICTED: vitelline membrane outer layer protein 1 [Anolis carolinensis]XP_016848149.1 PREDICTED: vitelline membrane outer layer protein 1 [Anolis carolinensis]|eukprot:XP_008106237.1 PREDICTED: vitelline membrane outer layer protein 1 [Anolis carolinensis]
MDLRVSTLFVMLTYCFWYGDARNYDQTLTVANGGGWGEWAQPALCKEGYVKGFALKVEPYQGSLAWNDDTGLNGIRLYCDDDKKITSKVGEWGSWTKAVYCPKGHLTSFSLQVEPSRGAVIDDSAANNVRFGCTEGAVLTGEAHNWGDFGAWSESCSSGAICGLQTRVELPQGNGDDTALNDVKFFCCN